MSRLIQIENQTTVRNRNRRSIAEMLRLLMQKQSFDEEARDMAAAIVFLLREIYEGVEQSAVAWEKKDYWLKAERFMREWRWTLAAAADMDDVIRHEAWDLLPELLADLSPRFDDLKIKTLTRDVTLWRGAYNRLLAESPVQYPW
jgi:hypothetical protein